MLSRTSMGAGHGTVLAAATVYVEMATMVKELLEKKLVKDAQGPSTAESIMQGSSNSQITHTAVFSRANAKTLYATMMSRG
jgi:hypothetical protein